ncbi:F-box domain cyclin-containing protein [Neofusicoccum parvum]|uniref:F-box domain cyclin-containing protein n=1 Tax=Neofusicoccum parvum TaxID=310453 RepID=A0ACB5SG79_9PEZI|nr:F-box domain cyclin-containing protein [Neofusicoccum parvum]
MSIAEHVRRFQLFRGAHPGPSPASVLQNFYVSLKRLHYRISCQSHSVRWEHGYYGAARFWRNFWGQERGWEWLCADPANISNLTEWVLSQLRPVSDHDPPPLKFPVLDDDTAPYPRPALDGMPIDVLRRIASFLPTASVLRLRRCSKPLANRIELRQSFWRDGLVAGDLVSFLWDLDGEKCRQADRCSSAPHDWRALARGLKAHKFVQAALRRSLARRPVEGYGIGYLDFYRAVAAQDEAFETDAPVGLLNRCRIAQVVADVEGIEDEELHDCHVPLSDEEEIYAAMWIMQVQRPEKFDEYRIRRSLELVSVYLIYAKFSRMIDV